MKVKLISTFIFLLLFTFLFSTKVFAETIRSFNVNVLAHKDGKMDVMENIAYDFEDAKRHGIYRHIPLFSKVGDLYRIIKIDNVEIERDGNREKFETNTTKEQIYFKIGDAGRTITGPHVYRISYTVENGIGSNFATHDEIYWNATGNNWEVPIEKASIKFSTDFGAEQTDLICFTGRMGSKEKFCNPTLSTVVSFQSLNPGEGLTAVISYPKGTFPPSYLSKEPPKSLTDSIFGAFLTNIKIIWMILNIGLPLILIYWYETHKNKKRFGPPVVNFDIPKDERGERIIPAVAGTIDTADLERDDVVATLFDLAIRRYVKLEEIKTNRKLLPDKVKQKITKLKEGESLTIFERTLFDRLFRDGGNYVFAQDLKKDFYKTFEELEKEDFKLLVDKKYFIRNPKYQRGLLFVLGLISIGTINVVLGVVLILLAKNLIGRTALGDEIDFKIDGLKLFLKSMGRNYKWQAKNFYTVEQMIPYAMSLGYIDKFMEQLKIIKPDYNPSWYSGYSGSFYVSYGSFFSSVNSSITTSAPSSSSGSSGGFSGGGGGGGGGGSW